MVRTPDPLPFGEPQNVTKREKKTLHEHIDIETMVINLLFSLSIQHVVLTWRELCRDVSQDQPEDQHVGPPETEARSGLV